MVFYFHKTNTDICDDKFYFHFASVLQCKYRHQLHVYKVYLSFLFLTDKIHVRSTVTKFIYATH